MLSDEIRKYRGENHLTLEQMAEKSGISKSTLISIEGNKRKTTAIVEAKLRKVMGGK